MCDRTRAIVTDYCVHAKYGPPSNQSCYVPYTLSVTDTPTLRGPTVADLLRSYLHVQPHRVRPRGVMGALAWLGVCVGTGNATGPRGCGSSVCTSVAIGLSPPSLLKASVELRFPRYISAQLVFPDNAEFDQSPRDQRS